jgi:hypothetical protein
MYLKDNFMDLQIEEARMNLGVQIFQGKLNKFVITIRKRDKFNNVQKQHLGYLYLLKVSGHLYLLKVSRNIVEVNWTLLISTVIKRLMINPFINGKYYFVTMRALKCKQSKLFLYLNFGVVIKTAKVTGSYLKSDYYAGSEEEIL